MITRSVLIAALAVVAFAGAVRAADVPPEGASDMLLAPAEVRDLTRKAHAGDKDAAARLYIHFDASKEPKLAVKWLIEAAKLGDCGAVDTALTVEAPKIGAENLKLAKTYAAQWRCKPGASHATPPVPVMY